MNDSEVFFEMLRDVLRERHPDGVNFELFSRGQSSDDEETYLRVISTVLEHNWGFSVYLVHNSKRLALCRVTKRGDSSCIYTGWHHTEYDIYDPSVDPVELTSDRIKDIQFTVASYVKRDRELKAHVS